MKRVGPQLKIKRVSNLAILPTAKLFTQKNVLNFLGVTCSLPTTTESSPQKIQIDLCQGKRRWGCVIPAKNGEKRHVKHGKEQLWGKFRSTKPGNWNTLQFRIGGREERGGARGKNAKFKRFARPARMFDRSPSINLCQFRFRWNQSCSTFGPFRSFGSGRQVKQRCEHSRRRKIIMPGSI